MRTTDHVQNPASDMEMTFLRTLLAVLRMTGNVCRAVLRPARTSNSLLRLSDRELQDIGLSRDMIDPSAYGENDKDAAVLPPKSIKSVLRMIAARGSI